MTNSPDSEAFEVVRREAVASEIATMLGRDGNTRDSLVQRIMGVIEREVERTHQAHADFTNYLADELSAYSDYVGGHRAQG